MGFEWRRRERTNTESWASEIPDAIPITRFLGFEPGTMMGAGGEGGSC